MQCGIVGASGYSGGELLRLLARADTIRVVRATANTRPGSPWTCIHSSLRGVYSLVFEEFVPERMDGLDCVFLALPSGEAMRIVPGLLGRVGRIIDLGGDFRLADAHDIRTLLRPAAHGAGTARDGGLRSAGTLPGTDPFRIVCLPIPDATRQAQSWACCRH